MSNKRLDRKRVPARAVRRVFDEQFKREAVQMMLDGHAATVCGRARAISSGAGDQRSHLCCPPAYRSLL